MPVCNVLYLSQKRVVWLRLRQERLQTGWDGFQGAETMTNPQPDLPCVGMGGCCAPIPSHPPRARGSPPIVRDFSLQMGFQSEIFVLVPLRQRLAQILPVGA